MRNEIFDLKEKILAFKETLLTFKSRVLRIEIFFLAIISIGSFFGIESFNSIKFLTGEVEILQENIDSLQNTLNQIDQKTNEAIDTIEVTKLTAINEIQDYDYKGFEANIEEVNTSNGWINYGGGFSKLSYFKDLDNMVHLRGKIRDGSGNKIFTLGNEFRPSCNESHLGVRKGNRFTRVDIDTLGVVRIVDVTFDHTDPTNWEWISLDGISFSTVKYNCY